MLHFSDFNPLTHPIVCWVIGSIILYYWNRYTLRCAFSNYNWYTFLLNLVFSSMSPVSWIISLVMTIIFWEDMFDRKEFKFFRKIDNKLSSEAPKWL